MSSSHDAADKLVILSNVAPLMDAVAIYVAVQDKHRGAIFFAESNMEGEYCRTKLTAFLVQELSLLSIPVVLLDIIATYSADERFVRPCYLNQRIISRDRDGALYEATVTSVGETYAEVRYEGWIPKFNEVIHLNRLELQNRYINTQIQNLVSSFLKSSNVVADIEEIFPSILAMIRDSKISKKMTSVGQLDPRTVILHDILRFPNDQVMLRLEIDFNLLSLTSNCFLWIALTDVMTERTNFLTRSLKHF